MRKSLIFALLVAVLLIITFGLLLTGCGNMPLGPGNFSFNKIHIDSHQFSGCVEITKWYDNETGIEVSTKNGNYYFSEGTYFLVEDKCPICDKY